jgi:hypothetical protein
MLAARACHADTLRRALTGDDEARRLLSLLGVTPLDLQAIDHGRITRRKAALNEQEESTADAIDRALLWMSTTPPDAMSKMDAHYKALLEQSAASVNELRQRLQAEIMAHDATRLRADLAEAASEHGPLTDIATLTGMPVQVVHQPTSPEEYRFSVHVPGYEGVAGPTPRQALLKMREKVVEGIGGVAKPAPDLDPLTDLLVTTRRVVRAFRLSKAPEECRFGVGIESYLDTHGATPHEALSRMRDQVQGRLTGGDE